MLDIFGGKIHFLRNATKHRDRFPKRGVRDSRLMRDAYEREDAEEGERKEGDVWERRMCRR